MNRSFITNLVSLAAFLRSAELGGRLTRMNSASSRTRDLVAVAGLACGAVFGLAGTLVTQASWRQVFWAVDGIGLVVATSLLAVRFLRNGHDCIAAGFLVYAIAESVILSGTPAGLAASIPSFGAGVALWATSLIMTSIPKGFTTWIRVIACLAAVLFAITASRIFLGEQLSPTASPLPFFAYPFLILTFGGWSWTLLRREG